MNGIVYVMTNRNNGKRYVGQTTLDINERVSSHASLAKSGKDLPLYRDIREYGIDAFDIETIPCPIDDLSDLERDMITRLNTIENGYNSNIGGVRRGRVHKHGSRVKSFRIDKEDDIRLNSYLKENNISLTSLINQLLYDHVFNE